MFRQALAAAVANQSGPGPRLDLRNLKPKSDHFDKVASRHDWMRIGRWIEARHAEGGTYEEAIWRAVENFTGSDGAPISEGKCKKALGYYQRASRWVETAILSPQGADLGRDGLEKFHHEMDAAPVGSAFTQYNAKLIEQLGYRTEMR
ncbi:hypothetical protein [Sphingomonas sp. PWP1-2]|uniref:hypothetical protein n=1 Tax=Sphingomonas sp. PWP1-2 TaxID=2804558 RepID=UPI003CF6E466